nr:hypothetical protein [Tanacetum cinerariifolium]
METEVSPTETNTEEHIPIPSNDPLPSGEDRMQLKELMDLCTNLSNNVLDLENEIKTVNDDVWLQALIDGKKVVINEATIRHDLKLNDAE